VVTDEMTKAVVPTLGHVVGAVTTSQCDVVDAPRFWQKPWQCCSRSSQAIDSNLT